MDYSPDGYAEAIPLPFLSYQSILPARGQQLAAFQIGLARLIRISSLGLRSPPNVYLRRNAVSPCELSGESLARYPRPRRNARGG